MLSWVAPFDGNRPITQYVIYVSSSRQPNLTQIYPPLGGGRAGHQKTGYSTDPVPSVTVTDNPTTVLVSDLIPFVEYSYTVEAVNELGRSDLSQPSPFIRTEAAGESEEEQFIPIPLLDTSIMVVAYADAGCTESLRRAAAYMLLLLMNGKCNRSLSHCQLSLCTAIVPSQ